MTDHQKASVYHVATTGVRFRILKNISKYFEVFLQSLKHHKMTILGKVFRCFQLILLPFKNTHYVIVPIRTVVQKTQFHFVVNMHKSHFYKTKQFFVSYTKR